ncbi:glycosyltransferase [Maridesulfovibrio frigidus]|uniref:glycosyltransferase n=1 Tax=Maridesulfovibrio frigidus TaxID=340956 RepID=UPI0004E13216|nr:glycosyltransferase [Maridesulfovibrio frigidus]
MKVGYYLSDLTLTGGTKVINQHLRILDASDYDVSFFAKRILTEYKFKKNCVLIEDPAEMIGQVDVVIATRLSDFKECLKSGLGRVVMFYQRYELDDLQSYYSEKGKLDKYSSFLGRLFLKVKFALQKFNIERTYRSGGFSWTPCHTVAHKLDNKFHVNYEFIRNTVNLSLFDCATPNSGAVPSVLSIGDYRLGRKNIVRIFEAVRIIKQKMDINFIRVSPSQIYEEEIESGIVDEYYSQLDDDGMNKIYDKSDIVVAASLSEGFGMPALEGMAAGCVCVLSDIPAHNMFHELCEEQIGPYALYFDPESTVTLVENLQKALNHNGCKELLENGKKVAQSYVPELQKKDLLAALDKLK